ncbi:hypothetical protein JOB18_036920 [Solea senegalensis]|uniref:Uncharacterized protein n=1 Tax=Solea senegalensis TaxID=28829 RepID=A0AAV6SU26_SOLSE|nr:hypothetical protein JOB18_036920 [Solea senegalensis]
MAKPPTTTTSMATSGTSTSLATPTTKVAAIHSTAPPANTAPPVTTSSSTPPATPALPTPAPRTQRLRREVTSQTSVVVTHAATFTPEPEQRPRPPAAHPSNSCVSYEVASLFSLGTDGEDANSPTTTLLQPVRASPPLPRPSSLPTSFPQLTPTTRQRTLAGLMEPPSLGRRKATRHISTLRKMKDWHITVRKKVLIVGDSNVCRFPPFLDQRLQVDSYPGANFRHAAALMSKAITITPPELIVLAFGVNHRSQRAHSTSVKQLQAALRATKLRFPLARVLVPAINFSPALPQHEKFSLLALNRHIQEHCDSIPPLPREKFSTESDQIHWSRETAAAMFDHWCGHLN